MHIPNGKIGEQYLKELENYKDMIKDIDYEFLGLKKNEEDKE